MKRMRSAPLTDLPSLNALRAFEAVARYLSFTKAAQELCVTQSAVSRQVKNLEDELKIQLFSRVPGKLTLTDAGKTLYYSAHESFQNILEARKRIEEKHKKIKLTTPPTLTTRWLIPRLPRFHALHNRVQVVLETSTRELDLRYFNNFNAAITYREPKGGIDLIMEMLLREKICPICSPKLLSGDISLNCVNDLRHHTILHSTLDHMMWNTWTASMGVNHLTPAGELNFELEESSIQAAISGAGITFVNIHFVQDELTSGTLINPFPEIPPQPLHAYFLVYSGSHASLPSFMAFRTWLLEEVKQFLSMGN
jgi:LysR family glycine cleavage system transcriptional activator